MNDEQQNHKDIVSLRDHLEKLFGQYQEHHRREHELLSQSIDLARQTMEIRLEGMNEFRAQILTERAGMVTRDSFDSKADEIEKITKAQHVAEDARIVKLETELANLRGRMTATAAGISVALVVLQIVLRFVVK